VYYPTTIPYDYHVASQTRITWLPQLSHDSIDEWAESRMRRQASDANDTILARKGAVSAQPIGDWLLGTDLGPGQAQLKSKQAGVLKETRHFSDLPGSRFEASCIGNAHEGRA
jgi:hypothetical protein